MNGDIKKYSLSRIFDVNASQAQVSECFATLLDDLSRNNSLLMIGIGASGSGKSYSLGTSLTDLPESHGLSIRSMEKILMRRKPGERINVSAIELNADGIVDLIADSDRIVNCQLSHYMVNGGAFKLITDLSSATRLLGKIVAKRRPATPLLLILPRLDPTYFCLLRSRMKG